MALNAHLETLKRKHNEMSEAVEAAQRSPGIDDLEVATMKKEKLRLKEEISRLSSEAPYRETEARAAMAAPAVIKSAAQNNVELGAATPTATNTSVDNNGAA